MKPPNRPRIVTIILWGVILFGVWNLAKSVALWRQTDLLLLLEARPDPRLRLVVALIWVVCFFTAAMLLWQRRPLAQRLIPQLLLGHLLYELTLITFFAQTDLARRSWGLILLLHGPLIILAYWSLKYVADKSYFKGEVAGEDVG